MISEEYLFLEIYSRELAWSWIYSFNNIPDDSSIDQPFIQSLRLPISKEYLWP